MVVMVWFFGGRRVCSPVILGRMVQVLSLFCDQVRSSSRPPLARRPLTEPWGHAVGSAGQEVDGSFVALEKKFSDGGGGAEVSVDLEDGSFAGGVGVEEIDVGAVLHEHGEGLPCFVAVEEAGPEGDGPGAAPSGVGSSVGESAFEGDTGCLCQLGSFARSDLIAGIERVHVGHVALAGRSFFEVDGPLLELAVLADLIGDKARDSGVEFCGEVGVEVEFFGGGDAVGEELAGEGHVHGAAGAGEGGFSVGGEEVVLGGLGGAGGEAAFGVFDEPGEKEFGRALHERIGAGAEEFAVAGEEIVLVEMRAEPGAAHAPVGPGG